MRFFTKRKRSKVSRMMLALAMLTSLAATPAAALPDGATVIHGGANVNRNGQTMTIQQTTQQAIINWNGFSISANELVQFLQPGVTASVLNRVTGVDPSVINGILQGNGNIFLINPNGVLIGPGGMVNAGGFLASTLELSNSDFLTGNLRFKQGSGHDLAALVNQGQIKVTDGGFVVLMAPSVANEGLIVAKNGEVALGAGKEATMNFDGRNLIHFATSAGPSTGGTVVMSQASANNVLSQVVNNLGIEEAGSLSVGGSVQAGDITLQGVNAQVDSGTLVGENFDMDFTGDVDLGSQYTLDGGSILVTATGNITFDTLVAERLNNVGGLVSLRADGSTGITGNSGGAGIAADLVELEATNGSISTQVAANAVVANAPNGNISLSLRPGIIDSTTGGSGSGSSTGTGGSTSPTTGGTGTGGTGSTGTGSSGTGSSGGSSSGGSSSGTSGISSGSHGVRGIAPGGSGSSSSSSGGGSGATTGASNPIYGTGGRSASSSSSSSNDAPSSGTDLDVLQQSAGTDGITTAVGINGTRVTAHAGGDVAIDSVNTVVVEQISGRNVYVRSQTGSVVDSGDRVGADNRDIIASQNANLVARDYIGTIDDPLEVQIGGDLDVLAGSEIDGISGVLVGDVLGQFRQNDETAGVVLLNPGAGYNNGIQQALRGVMDNGLPGDDTLGGSNVANLYLLRLVNAVDDEDWLQLLRGTVVWEDSDEEATEADL